MISKRNWIKIGLISAILSGISIVVALNVYPLNCPLIGTDWCNFSEAESLFQESLGLSEIDRYQKLTFHCSQIRNGAKQNKCYYFAASISDGQNMLEACNKVIDNWGKSTEDCIRNHGYRAR